MSLLRRAVTQRNTADPTKPLTDESLVSLLAGGKSTSSGVNVDPDTALKFTAVLRAINLIASTSAGLPLKTYRRGTRLEESTRIVDDPNPELTKFELWERQFAHLAGWGNAYMVPVEDAPGRIAELWPLMPDRVAVRRDSPTPSNPAGKVFEVSKADRRTDGRLVDEPNKTVELPARGLIHVPGFGYDGLVGMSPIGYAREAIGAGLAAEEAANRMWSSGMMSSGVLQTDKKIADETEAESIKQRFMRKVAGREHAHEVAVLDQGVNWQQISLNPDDAQFLESRKFQVTEIARLYGIPPHLLGDVERSTSWGTGIEEQTIGFVVFTLQPGYLQRAEQRVTKRLVPPQRYAEFTVDGLLRGDSKTRAEVYTAALDPETGWMVRDEVRQRENLPIGQSQTGRSNGEVSDPVAERIAAELQEQNA